MADNLLNAILGITPSRAAVQPETGMFGVSPYEVEQQRYAQDAAFADKYAQMAPFAKAESQLARAGAGIGRGVGGMMGMVDPRVEQAKQQQSIQAQIDHNSVEGLLKGAQLFNAAGNPRMAFMYTQAAQAQKAKEEKDAADIALKKAHAKYYETQGLGLGKIEDPNRVANRNWSEWLKSDAGQASTLEQKDAMKGWFQQQAMADFQSQVQMLQGTPGITGTRVSAAPQPSQMVAPTSTQPITVSGNEPGLPKIKDVPGGFKGNVQDIVEQINQIPDPNERAAAMAQLKSQIENRQSVLAGIPTSAEAKAKTAGNVALAQKTAQSDVALSGAEAEAKKTGTDTAEMNVKQFDAANKASQNLAKIDALEKHLKESQAITGLGASMLNNIERAKALFGSKAAQGKVTDTELLDIMLGSDVFPMIGELGIGARGMDTPAEREFMRQVLTGTIQLNKETLVRMAEIRRNMAERAIDAWNARVDKGELSTFFKARGLPASKIEKPQRSQRTVVRTGKANGRKVNQYSDGSIEYAD